MNATPLGAAVLQKTSLVKIVSHGAEQSKRTNWARWPGFNLAHLSNGKTRYFPENTSQADILKALQFIGVNTIAYEKQCAQWKKALDYPPKPKAINGLYQHNYGYSKPVNLDRWEWSVTFEDGWQGFTYPKVN